MIRVVIDTNVLISSLLTGRGYPSRVVEALLRNEFKAVVSDILLQEVRRVSTLPKFSRYPSLETRVNLLADFLNREGEVYPGIAQERVITDDPEDDFVLACAAEGKADYIVTGDHHLLELGLYQGVQIITPREFTELLERQSHG